MAGQVDQGSRACQTTFIYQKRAFIQKRSEALPTLAGCRRLDLTVNTAGRDSVRRRADEVGAHIIDWAADVTGQKLLDTGLARGVPLGPYRSMHDVAECPHFNGRGFDVDYGSATAPGRPVRRFVEQLTVALEIGGTDLDGVSSGSER